MIDDKSARERLQALEEYCARIPFGGKTPHKIPADLLAVIPRAEKAQATTVETEGGSFETFEAVTPTETVLAPPELSESDLMGKWLELWDQAHAAADMGVMMGMGAKSDFASVGASPNGHKIGERFGAEILRTTWGRRMVASPAFQDMELLFAVLAYGGQMRGQFASIAEQRASGQAQPLSQKLSDIATEVAA